MSHELLIAAAQTHQPPLPHLAILGVVAIAVVGWLLHGAVSGRRRRGRDCEREQGSAGTHIAAESPSSDRGPER